MRVASFFLATALLFNACLPARTKVIRVVRHPEPSGKFTLPLKRVTILSKFGKRSGSFHTGLDLRGRRGGGDSVLASRAGRVVLVGRQSGYGLMITVVHGDGFKTRYAHLAKALVKKGALVKEQQPIGIVGRSGRASTEHLHFEVLTPKGRFVNPEPLLFG